MMSAQDSVRVYADTFRMYEHQTIDDSDWLLQQLASQAEQIYVKDSIQRDSLIMSLEEQQRDLWVQMMIWQDRLQHLNDSMQYLNDSIDQLHRLQLTRVPPPPTIDTLKLYLDSLSREVVSDPHTTAVTLTPRQRDNAKDDLAELKASLKAQRTHWYKEGNIIMQFSQSYASPNWYGGSSPLAFALIANFKERIAYINNNIAWENNFYWRTGLSTTPSDSLRKYNVTDDLIRINSKFGYKVFKSLYVSTSADFQTTQWNQWKTNKRELQSAFLTPIYFNLNVGIDYKPLEGLSIAVYPANYKLVYALNARKSGVDVTAYGIKAGKDFMNEFGSSVRINWHYKIIREIVIDTELYFYTNYKAVEIDWEINADFIINRFLSAHVMLRPRFDNTKHVAGEPRDRIQFKDLLSIGFSHKFY